MLFGPYLIHPHKPIATARILVLVAVDTMDARMGPEDMCSTADWGVYSLCNLDPDFLAARSIIICLAAFSGTGMSTLKQISCKTPSS